MPNIIVIPNKMASPKVYITNIQSFSAAHRLHNPDISDEENVLVFGKCNHVNSHGHNYKIEACVSGHIDPRTGCVMNLRDLKKALLGVIEVLDHRRLDVDVDYFKNHVPTAENIAVYIWKELSKSLPVGVKMHNIRVFETDKNLADYRGE